MRKSFSTLYPLCGYNDYVNRYAVLLIGAIVLIISIRLTTSNPQTLTPTEVDAQNACTEGDANGDGRISLVDYEVWRRVFKAGGSAATPTTGAASPTLTPPGPTVDLPQTTVLAENLSSPWGLVFLPNGSILFTERPGRVRLFENGQLQSAPAATIQNVAEIEEGGLMGIEIHPQFATNGYVYLMYTQGTNNTDAKNRVVRMKYENKQLTGETVIIDAIPATAIHKGGRIKFGPDGFLYITTGDTNMPSLAQDTNSLAGKILRVTDTGAPAPGNPFGNRTYSYGHRNPQGIAWDAAGQLWETEHGETALDEVNKITVGANYGWPTIRGDQTQTGMITPLLNSGTDTWAPAGTAVIGSSLYFGGLRGEALYQVTLPGATNLKTHLKSTFGRIRDVVKGPDGMLYVTTTNIGHTPRPGDDKLIRINPGKL